MQKNNSFNVVSLTSTALLVAISIVLGRFAIMIPLFGFPSVRFSFTAIPIFIAGSMFGGVLGAIAGLLSDLINFALTGGSTGPFYPGFTLNSILTGLIPGILFSRLRSKQVTFSFNKVNSILSIAALIGAGIYINFIGIHEVENLREVMGLPVTFFLTGMMIVLVAGLNVMVYYVQKHFKEDDGIYSVDKVLLATIISYMFIHFLLTPIWLRQLYGIPISASVAVRMLKCLIDIPLQASLVYIILKVVPTKVKGRLAWSSPTE